MLVTKLTPELYCSNIDASLAFYVDVLGFNIQYERKKQGFAMLERQGSRLMLDEYDPASRTSWIAGPLENPFGRGINFQMETDNVDALYDRVQKAGATIFLLMREKWYRGDNIDIEMGNREFIVLDPDGYMLRFFQDLGDRPVSKL